MDECFRMNEDRNSIAIADVSQLPQHPIFDKDRRKINRLIIVKFLSVFDKYTIRKDAQKTAIRRMFMQLSICRKNY